MFFLLPDVMFTFGLNVVMFCRKFKNSSSQPEAVVWWLKAVQVMPKTGSFSCADPGSNPCGWAAVCKRTELWCDPLLCLQWNL